jgi:hypothetical protein
MKYYIGQRVSLLHDSGEGTVVSIIDKYHVEVDFGDDFPFDVHVEEIIPINPEEEKYFLKEKEEVETVASVAPQVLGRDLKEISLAITQQDDTTFDLTLLNPEAHDALYAVYCKRKHKYEGLAYGKAAAGGKDKLASLKDVAFHDLKALDFQVLFYRVGTGLPIPPLAKEFSLKKGLLDSPTLPVQPLDREGWLFSLRSSGEAPNPFPAEKEQEWVQAKKESKRKREGERIVDLHIEELTIFPHQLAPSEILEVQLEHFEQSLSKALLDDVGRLILIHGVGEGKLRAEIRSRLKASPQVRQYYPASPARFGNGATEVILQ